MVSSKGMEVIIPSTPTEKIAVTEKHINLQNRCKYQLKHSIWRCIHGHLGYGLVLLHKETSGLTQQGIGSDNSELPGYWGLGGACEMLSLVEAEH